jgi:hypothetical protein
MNYFDEVFNRLKEKLKFKSDKEMYDYMGIIQGTFTNWRRRNKIPYKEINSICIKEKLDLNYIINGKNSKNSEEKIDYKKEITKKIEELREKELKYFYHLIEAELTKKEL